MHLIAMLTMLIDHIGYIFFPDEQALRAIGRLSFPIYCYALVQGHVHTTNRFKYLLRLSVIAALSQIPYILALNPFGFNVVASLLAAALVLAVWDYPYKDLPRRLLAGIPATAAACALLEFLPFSYGAYGLLLVLTFRFAKSSQLVGLQFALNLAYMAYTEITIQFLSLIPAIAIVTGPSIWTRMEKMTFPRWIWRAFYTTHLADLAILKVLLLPS